MAIHIFTWNPGIEFNTSLQVGDIVYQCLEITVGGFGTANPISSTDTSSDIFKIGKLVQIDTVGSVPQGNSLTPISRLHIDAPVATYTWATPPAIGFLNQPTTNDFLMFSKDNEVNLSSIVGYYAEVQIVNNATGFGPTSYIASYTSDIFHPHKLFSVNAGVLQSSK